MSAVIEKQSEPAQKALAPWVSAMQKAEPKFKELAEIHNAVNWKAEANYARQLIQRNERIMTCKPQSIMDAVINVAAIGLSLSPAEKLAYLVPRGDLCVLDISYMGLIKLATDTGSCDYIRADIIRENDRFDYKGPAAKADFSTSHPFNKEKRGAIVGVYAETRLASGGYLTELMDMDDLAVIMNASKAKTGPWKSYWNEMAKKSVIKRLAKTIPPTAQSGRLHKAIEVVNEHEGIEFDEPNALTDEHVKTFVELAKNKDGFGLIDLEASLPDTDQWLKLFNSLPDGKKTEYKNNVRNATQDAHTMINDTVAELEGLAKTDSQFDAIALLNDVPLRYITPLASNELAAWLETLTLEDAA